VIAKGTGKDVVAGALLFSGTCPNTTVSLDFSDYATTQTQTDACGGIAAVSPAGSGSNQVTAPLLNADGFHQVPGSITINHGFTDGSSGPLDIDSQARTIGSAADIGADELADATNTSVSCLPDSLTQGAGSSNCVVTVTDTSSPTPTTPAGPVTLSSNNAGTIGSGCAALSMVSSTQANCTVTYAPTGTGTHQITGSYVGDSTHEGSQGTSLLSVIAPAGQSGGPGTTTPPQAQRKCKKKKKHRGAVSAKKKKCKKKRS
jgi:hypothetical protein